MFSNIGVMPDDGFAAFLHPLEMKGNFGGCRNKSGMTVIYFLFAILIFSSCSYFNSSKLINGSKAPKISLPDVNGQQLDLSSFKGKLVLVDFWASWCKPCREENSRVVSLYKKYKDASFREANGFVIYSVSLDSEKDRWQAAIKEDNLCWPQHLCDLKGWRSPAVDSFQVNAIPSSFLIDSSGIIIGKDLKPRDLDKLLSMLTK